MVELLRQITTNRAFFPPAVVGIGVGALLRDSEHTSLHGFLGGQVSGCMYLATIPETCLLSPRSNMKGLDPEA